MALHHPGKIFTPPLLLNSNWVPEAKNYRTTKKNEAKNYHMTKKKGSASFHTTYKSFFTPIKNFFCILPKNFTPAPEILHHPGWHGWPLFSCLCGNTQYIENDLI